jgi:flavodoxin
MKALVVYDSFFSNTEQVAQAIGGALGSEEEVSVLRVGDVKPEHMAGLDVLVVGSPTRAFSPTPAIRKLVGSIPRGSLAGVKVAGFDTRMDIDQAPRILRALVKVFGYAAEPIAAKLEKRGGERTVSPGGFVVEGTEGPMRDGELERAAEWAGRIISGIRG